MTRHLMVLAALVLVTALAFFYASISIFGTANELGGDTVQKFERYISVSAALLGLIASIIQLRIVIIQTKRPSQGTNDQN